MDTGGIFEFIGSNAFTFVRDEDITNPQTDDNRLYGDYTYFNQYNIAYYQKVEQTDSPFFQFIMDYSTVTFSLVSEDGTETSLLYTLVSESDSYKRYNCFVDVSSLSGCYYIKMNASSDEDKVILNYTSNYFSVAETWKNTLMLQWYGNNAYSDGFEWGDYSQELRVEALFLDNNSAGDITTMVDSDNNIELLNYRPAKRKTLQLDLVPDYIAQLLNRAIGHDLFIINGQIWKIDGLFDFGDRHGRSRMYSPKIELQLKNYENYTNLEEKTGTFPILETKSLQFDTGIALQFDTGIGLRFQ